MESCKTTGTCESCQSKCSHCFGSTESNCLGCSPGFAYDSSSNIYIATSKQCYLGEFPSFDKKTQ